MTTTHICISLDKILELTMNGIEVLDNDGEPLTEIEVYEFVKNERVKGYSYFSSCDCRTPIGKCAGHITDS